MTRTVAILVAGVLAGCGSDGPRTTLAPPSGTQAWSDAPVWYDEPALLVPPGHSRGSGPTPLQRERQRLVARQNEFARARAEAQRSQQPANPPPPKALSAEKPRPRAFPGTPSTPVYDSPKPSEEPPASPATQPSP